MSSSGGTSRGESAPKARWIHLLVISLMALILPLTTQTTAAQEAQWVLNHAETQLWSGPDSQAVSFGQVPQWSHFQVVAPQQGPRLYVFNPRTNNYAYIDAAAVGPSAAPSMPSTNPASNPGPAAGSSPPATQMTRTPPALPGWYQPWWVANFEETELWSGPEGGAASLGRMHQFRRFMVIEPQNGGRLHVWYPEKDITGYLDAAVAGPSVPSVWLETHQVRAVRQVNLPGRSIGNSSYVRALPVQDDETELRHAPNNTPLQVRELLVAADGTEWYSVGDGEYIPVEQVRLPRPPDSTLSGRWIDADLTVPAMVTAYEDGRVVYSALAIKGVAATSTPRGTFYIQRRVQNEIMNSETLSPPIPRDAPGGYYLKDVLYTQYFTSGGHSLHYNYWLGTFGQPGSNGCLGLNLTDARWFWDWATIGTPVVSR